MGRLKGWHGQLGALPGQVACLYLQVCDMPAVVLLVNKRQAVSSHSVNNVR